ncbi:hypothetical protein [Conyzicola nivalis]|uniref:hypothetical protein n=1 Tax=Conyzicola nivalis TaxID=1477021 RepID=UPI003399288C
MAVVGPRWGRFLAVPAVSTSVVLLSVLTLGVTPLLGFTVGLAVIAVLFVATASGVFILVRSTRPLQRPSAAALAQWLPSLLGAIVWISSRLVAHILPGAAKLSWSMEGDTTNNLLYARRIVADHGILLGGAENPVPLPVGILALPLSIERLVTPADDLLRSDIAVFGWAWTLVIAAACVAVGAVVASCAPPTRPRIVAIASAAGSLLPLTWLVSGLPIDFGFFNVPFAIPILMTCWLLYLGAERSPFVSIVSLLAAATLLLLIWTPALLIPAFLGIVIVIRDRRRLLRLPARDYAVPLGIVAVFSIVLSRLTLPAFAAQATSFDAGGMGYPPTWLLVAPIAAGGVLIVALLRTRTSLPVFAGFVAVVLGCYAGVGLLLFISRDHFNPWTSYYPVKFAWLSTVVLLPIVLSLAIGLLSAIRRPAFAASTVVAASTIAITIAALAPIPTPIGYETRQPIDRMLGGYVWNTGDEAVETILKLSQREELALLWHSNSPDEAMINYWVIDAFGGHLEGDETLRRFSFSDYSAFRQFNAHRPDSTNDLCQVLRDPSSTLTVYTDDADLEASLPDWCEGGTASFVLGQTPGVDY